MRKIGRTKGPTGRRKRLQMTNKAMGYGKKKNQGRVVRPWFIRDIF